MIELGLNCRRAERRPFAGDDGEVGLSDDAGLGGDGEVGLSVLAIVLRGRSRVARRLVDRRRFAGKRRFAGDGCEWFSSYFRIKFMKFFKACKGY